MVLNRLKKSRSARKRMEISNALMITSMMDIMTTILFFLLKNYSTVVNTYNPGKDIVLPQSTAWPPPPGSSLSLVVTKNVILLDDKELVKVVNGDISPSELHRDGVTITKLAQAFMAHKKRSLFVQQRNDAHSFTGAVVMQADKDLTFNLLKKVIYTAGITDFVMLRLIVLKKEV